MGAQSKWMGIDLGTSAVKCLIAGADGRTICLERAGYAPLHTEGSRVEQAPDEWWDAVCAVTRRCMNAADGGVGAVSFSGQMSALVLLGADGRPLRRSMLIADARADKQAAFLERQYGARFRANTGNRPIEAFSAAKLLWLAENEPALLARADRFVFVKDYIRYRLTGVLCTEPTDAGNSLLVDGGGAWDWTLIRALGLPERLFPPIRPSAAPCGAVTEQAARQTGLPAGTPVIAGAADMACSQLGAGALDPSRIAVTLSTSAQVVRAVDGYPAALQGKLTFHPAAAPGGVYAMASVFSGGLALEWAHRLLADGAPMTAETYRTLEQNLAAYHAAHGPSPVLFLPFLTGSGSPAFDSRDRAAFWGLTPATGRTALTAAVLEGVGYCIRENVALLDPDGGAAVCLAGGGSRLAIWGQMLCEILGRPVALLARQDTAVWGAAMLAAQGAGADDTPLRQPAARCMLLPDSAHTAAYQTQYRAYGALQTALRQAIHEFGEKE